MRAVDRDGSRQVDARRRRPGPRLLLAALVGLLGLVGVTVRDAAPVAQAVSPGSHGNQIVNEDPVNNTPHALDGYVRSFAEVGTTVLAAGNFTRVRTAASATQISRSHLFAFTKSTGAILPMNVALNGEVFSVLPTGDGQTVFIAGSFSTVNGATVRSLAKINVATGQRVTTFNPPSFNGRIHDIALRNGKLYLSGRFTTVGAAAHTLLAAVNPTTGALDPNVKMTFSDPRRGGALSLMASDITPDGSRLVGIGNFTKVNGGGRYQIVVINLATSPPTLANWATEEYGDGCSSSFQSYMRDIEIDPTGTYFSVVTTGAYSNVHQCDTTARWEINATGDQVQPTWTNYTGGDTLTATAISEAAVYIGGHNGWMNNPYAADRIGNGAVLVEGLAALDPRSGAVLDWTPERTLGYGVYGFSVVNDGMWIGSDTDRLYNFEYHGRLAFTPLAGGHALPNENTGAVPGRTVTITSSNVITRDFNGAGSTQVSSTNASGWSGFRGGFMISGQLYSGWSDRTFKKQSYDGSTFGARTTIPLQRLTADHPGGPGDPAESLNRFASQDLGSMTAMFYDKVTGRIYFTKSGENRLYYRSFSIDDDIVGAHRQNGPGGNINGLDWRNVRGMFLAGDRLYIADSTGRLTRWNWSAKGGPEDATPLSPSAYSGTPVNGTNVAVSGPAIDGVNWNGADTFLYAGNQLPPNQAPVANATASCSAATCSFSSTGSSDPDGSIVSYSWNFGDGTAAGSGASVSHTYAAAGSYNAALTVTDNRGATAIDSVRVTVAPAANVPPAASFTASCGGLSCSFTSTSTDSDGTIVSTAWNFGDGTTGSGTTTSRTYAAPGTYTVAMTVTDDDGAPATSSRSIVVTAAPAGAVNFRAKASTNVNSPAPRVIVPSSVAAGDVMLLFVTANDHTRTITGPAGWTELRRLNDAAATMQTVVWSRKATAADANTSVGPNLSGAAKQSLTLVAYSSANVVSASAISLETATVATHTTPSMAVATANSAVVSYWGEKSSTTTAITPPGGVVQRDTNTGAPSGQVTSLTVDRTAAPAGTSAGVTATANSAGRRVIMVSVVVAPS